MSRTDAPSLLVRGVPELVLERLARFAASHQTTKNAIAQNLIRDYGAGAVTPKASPPPFDPKRNAAAPHGDDTGPLAISHLEPEVYQRFLDRAKLDGWYLKNALIVELLRDTVG